MSNHTPKMSGRPRLVRRARNKREKVSSHDPGPGIYKRFDTSGKLRQPHPCEVSLPSVRLDQDGKERKQNFKLCNIETAGGKCFSESAAGPIGMLGEFVHSQLSSKGAMDHRTRNRCLHRLNDWLKFGRPEDLRACPQPIQTAVLDWVHCLPSLQLGRNIAEDSWSRDAVDSLLADFPRPLKPLPSKIQSLVHQAARLLDSHHAAQESSEVSEVSHLDLGESDRWQQGRPTTSTVPCAHQPVICAAATLAASLIQDGPAQSYEPGQTQYEDACIAQRGHPEQVSSRQHSISSPHTPPTRMDPWRHHMRTPLDTTPQAGSTGASIAALDMEDELAYRHGGMKWGAPAQPQLLLHEALPWQPDHTWHGCTFL